MLHRSTDSYYLDKRTHTTKTNRPILLISTDIYSDHGTHAAQIIGTMQYRSADQNCSDHSIHATQIIRPMLLRSLSPCYIDQLTHKFTNQINIPYFLDQRTHINQINGPIPPRSTDLNYSDYSTHATQFIRPMVHRSKAQTTQIIGPMLLSSLDSCYTDIVVYLLLRSTDPYYSNRRTHNTKIFGPILFRPTDHIFSTQINIPIILRFTDPFFSDQRTNNTHINKPTLLTAMDPYFSDERTHNTKSNRPMLGSADQYYSDQRTLTIQINGPILLRSTDPYY
ncbi:unnamed protein product [Mytilus coruscus]|uniref:Uncharacterized protein n=1 Tax=Mytilus coruscus TaxID=42192 RepID=A0A6J8CJ69_MYTCO|nr:unnamed protein product [Mytilus coruscus]